MSLPTARRVPAIPGWLPSVVLLLGTAIAGPALGGASRPVFVLGCAAAGWFAWRHSPAAHLQSVLLLFCFAPFVRRLIDLTAGYDQQGLLLIGPLLAILMPGQELMRLLRPNDAVAGRSMAPALIVALTVLYATLLSIAQADWTNAASGALKWTAPIIYALALIVRRPPGLAEAAARAFLFILPLAGAYGILQYVDPQPWDRYWMQYASITSAGVPEPYQVRVYSTMNSPASYATFTAAGLLLVGFLRPGWQALALMLPAALGLLLSLYRTAWLSLAAGILFCLLFAATRGRALGAIGGGALAIVVAATLTPFADTIMERLGTLGEGSKDGSGQERLGEMITLWSLPDSGLVGQGFTITDAGSAGAMPIDGMIVTCWVTMGIVVGLVCLAALILAALQAIGAAWQRRTPASVVLGGLAVGALVQLPLAGISSGELGVLFWTFVAAAIVEADPA